MDVLALVVSALLAAEGGATTATGKSPPAPAPVEPTDDPPRRGGSQEAPPGTQRSGTISGVSLAVFGGITAFKRSVANRAGIGPGKALGLSLAMTLWDQVPIGFSFGPLVHDDHRPFTETVVDCTEIYGTLVGCGDPHEQKSMIIGTTFTIETGYQHRFRPALTTSLLPAAVVGYLWNPAGIKRTLECDGCRTLRVPGVTAGGIYVGPSFKLTMLDGGVLAIGLRTELYLTGDLGHRTIASLEIGKP